MQKANSEVTSKKTISPLQVKITQMKNKFSVVGFLCILVNTKK